MPRANRLHLDNQIVHITHRCHRRQFLLRFARDRRVWIRWLYEARKRYGLCVLDYQVTHNHIHLLVRDRGGDEIPKSMQLIAGRTGQQYNRRKGRGGAFWQDRYHATIVDSEGHLIRCLIYIDLNMVRAGVVHHPQEWPDAGYHEIQCAKPRYRIVDRSALGELLEIDSRALAALHRGWIDDSLAASVPEREPAWSTAVAVGRTAFVEQVQHVLGHRGRFRRIDETTGSAILREPGPRYRREFSALWAV